MQKSYCGTRCQIGKENQLLTRGPLRTGKNWFPSENTHLRPKCLHFLHFRLVSERCIQLCFFLSVEFKREILQLCKLSRVYFPSSGWLSHGISPTLSLAIAVPNSAPVAQPAPLQPKQPAAKVAPVPKNRRPEELDALAAQLNDLGGGGSGGGGGGQPNPPGVEDDDSDDDSAAPPAGDGTLLASEPPRPL